MKCVLSLDDFCYQHRESIKYIEELFEYFDNFKISMFTIPRYEDIPLFRNLKWFFNLPRIEFILHGYYHMNYEFKDLNFQQCIHFIKSGIEEFKVCNIKIVKGFKAPNWRYNEDLIKALKSLGFWLAVYTPGHMTKEIPCYTWNWDIGTDIPDVNFLHAHGHVHRQSGPGAYIGDCLENIKKLPKDTKFYYVGEFMNNEKSIL